MTHDVSRLHFDVSRTKILACRKGRHTSSVTKEGGWNRKIRRATKPAMNAPSKGAAYAPTAAGRFTGGAQIAR
jgi:hypothetical protein